MTNAVSEIEVRTLTIPKPSAKNIVIMALGAFTLLLSVLFIISIILMIPGFFGLLIGFFILRAGAPRVSFDCMACGQSVKVMAKEKSGVCEHCKTANPLVWAEPNTKLEAE